MAAVPRSEFLPHGQRAHAHRDEPLGIGHGQTNSQPSTVAAMLELLNVPGGAGVLDVGCGSGWTTAILAELVGRDGRVIGTELVPELSTSGAQALSEHLARSTSAGRAEIRQAQSGILGSPTDAPFDRILVSAGAQQMPEDLIAQLGPGAVMVIPVANVMHRVVRTGLGAPDEADDVQVTTHGMYRFVPLR